MTVACFIVQHIANRVEDAPVAHRVSGSDQLMSDGLTDVTLADARRSKQQEIAMLANEVTGSEVEDRVLAN